jgi:hypothetical protein
MQRGIMIPVAVVVLLGAVATAVLAQTGGDYDLSWSTVDGGGGSSSGGEYVLDGTIGQPDAGAMTGAGYSLQGGFWRSGGSAAADRYVYLSIIMKP